MDGSDVPVDSGNAALVNDVGIWRRRAEEAHTIRLRSHVGLDASPSARLARERRSREGVYRQIIGRSVEPLP